MSVRVTIRELAEFYTNLPMLKRCPMTKALEIMARTKQRKVTIKVPATEFRKHEALLREVPCPEGAGVENVHVVPLDAKALLTKEREALTPKITADRKPAGRVVKKKHPSTQPRKDPGVTRSSHDAIRETQEKIQRARAEEKTGEADNGETTGTVGGEA